MTKATKNLQPKQLEKWTKELVARSDKGLGTKHGHKPVSVMLPPELDDWVRSLDYRSEWIRQAIVEKFKREQDLPSCYPDYKTETST